jgi:hypothetical protein
MVFVIRWTPRHAVSGVVVVDAFVFDYNITLMMVGRLGLPWHTSQDMTYSTSRFDSLMNITVVVQNYDIDFVLDWCWTGRISLDYNIGFGKHNNGRCELFSTSSS